MVPLLSRFRRRDDGAVAIITAILTSLVFIGLCALVVDLGLARDTRRQAQNAADAAALAAGNALYPSGTATAPPQCMSGSTALPCVTDAIAAAEDYALKNYGVAAGDWADVRCSYTLALAVPSDNPCISFDVSVTAVRVILPTRDVTTVFAQIWGRSSVAVNAVATIKLNLAGDACGLCVLGTGTGSDAHKLGNGQLQILGANVAMNGELNVTNWGDVTLDSGYQLNLQNNPTGPGVTNLPAPIINPTPIVDPLANFVMPPVSYYPASAPHQATNTCPGAPGVYDHLSTCLTMAPGLYILTGDTNNVEVAGVGVTLYLVCGSYSSPAVCPETGTTSARTGGTLHLMGAGGLDIAAPSAGSGTVTDTFAIISDRNNVGDLEFGGTAAGTTTGTIYALSGKLRYDGGGSSETLDSLIVVGDIDFNGLPTGFISQNTLSLNSRFVSSDLHLSQ